MNNNKTFEGKVALVTGGTSGIGKTTAIAFARAGAKVVLSGRREKEGAQVVAEIKKLGGDAAFVRADVAKDADVKAMVKFAVDKFGRLDIAFNNAGVEWKGPLEQATEGEYRRIFDINVRGVLNSMRHEIPVMLKNGGGAIVNTSSVAGHVGLAQISVYIASKHAVEGLTKSVALELATHGAAVVVNYASAKSDADKVVDQISKGGGNAVAVQASVAKKADVEKLFSAAEKAFGKIDVLVNNAGVYEFMPVEEVTEPQFRRMFDTNVLGMILATQEALKHFNPSGGSIINISSLASSLTPPTGVVYNATKGAVDAITRTLAKELGPRKIRVNAIRPGMVITDGVITAGIHESEFRTMLESQTPLGRVGQTDDIAPAALFFASDDSKWVTGETLLIAGGLR